MHAKVNSEHNTRSVGSPTGELGIEGSYGSLGGAAGTPRRGLQINYIGYFEAIGKVPCRDLIGGPGRIFD
jgi:hypothetical protein